MARVVLSGPLKLAAGVGEMAMDVRNIRDLLVKLEDLYPSLKPMLAKGVAISIDGQIYRDDWFQPIPAEGEVHVLVPMAGG